MNTNRFSILLITDDNDQAKTLSNLIKPAFPIFFIAKSEEAAIKTIVKERITIVLMGLSSLHANEAFYLHLISAKENVTEIIRRKFLLCSKNEIREAFSICNKEIFDDYFITRPLYDPYHILIRLRFLKRLFKHDSTSTSATMGFTMQNSSDNPQHNHARMANLCDYFDRVISCESDVTATNTENFEKLLETISTSMAALKQMIAKDGKIPKQSHEQIASLINNHGEQKLLNDVQERRVSTQQKLALQLNEVAKIARIKKEVIEHPPAPDINDAEILVVEDEKQIREDLVNHLQQCGCKVYSAASAMDAVSQLEQQTPAYVLLDLTLPDMSPFFVINKLKGSGTAIIVLARPRDTSNVEECLNNGAHGVITKPVDYDVLTHTIATIGNNAG